MNFNNGGVLEYIFEMNVSTYLSIFPQAFFLGVGTAAEKLLFKLLTLFF